MGSRRRGDSLFLSVLKPPGSKTDASNRRRSGGRDNSTPTCKSRGGADAYVLRRKPFRYGGAALIGFICGALLFLVQQLVLPTQREAQLQWLLAALLEER